MKRLISLTILVACLEIAGCSKERNQPKIIGSGVAKTETRPVESFAKVQFFGEGRVELSVGPLEPITLTADDNILPLMMTVVAGDTLTIRPSEESIKPKTPLVVRAAAPHITSVECVGSGDIVVRDLAAESVGLSVVGAGSVNAAGKTTSITVSIQGAGAVDTSQLEAERVSVGIAGAGSADVNATKNLDVDIMGAATVRYAGDPVVAKKVVGIGTVQRK